MHREGEIILKHDIKEYKMEYKYDTKENVINITTITKVEYVYGNISHEFRTTGKWILTQIFPMKFP